MKSAVATSVSTPYPPPPTSTLILKSSFSYTFLYLFCLETKHCLGFCAIRGKAEAVIFHSALFSPVWTVYSSQQFALYSVLLMSHRAAEKTPMFT